MLLNTDKNYFTNINKCSVLYYDFTSNDNNPKLFPFSECNCSSYGSNSTVCDKDGYCPCLSNFKGKKCSKCKNGFYMYPKCLSNFHIQQCL